MSSHYDVIIIGTGAGGGTLAYRLAPSGKRILLLERGDYVPREQDNWSTRAVNVDGKYQTKEPWRDKAGKALHPHTNYWVGGNTKFYGAALFRLRREDFGELRHHGGVSPAWPISYDELEPYYTEAEHLYQVHGERGEDPTEPPASAPYRYPAVSHEPRIQQLSDDFAALGLHPFHTPLGIMLDEKNRRAEPLHPLRHLRRPSLPGERQVRRAGRLRRSGAGAPQRHAADQRLRLPAGDQRLGPGGDPGRWSSGTAQRESYSADIVVSSCGAINSAALLLRSASDQHPRGLANGSDVVGRHYMGHVNSVLMALSKLPQPDRLPEDPRGERLLLRLAGVGLPDGAHLVRRQARRRHALGRRAGHRARLDAGADGQALARLLAHVGRPARPGQPGHARPRRQDRAVLHAEQRRRAQAAHRQAREA